MKYALLSVMGAGFVAFVSTNMAVAADQPTGERVTITGMAKAIGNAGGQLDPKIANATLTVTKEAGGSPEVYYVSGYAGVILAKQCDGKKAEVTGTLSQSNGKMTITGRSVDVKMDGVPVEGTKTPAKGTDATSGDKKTTVKGMAKAVGDIGEIGQKPNPAIANATLTFMGKDSAGRATEITCDVYGWAGVILAQKADGKQAEVTGVVSEKDGKMSIVARSVDVKVEGVPLLEGAKQPAKK